MRWNGQSSSRESEAGSTVLEVIITLFILSIIGAGVWQGVSVSLRLISRFHDRILMSARVLELDDKLRDLALRVRAPFWMSGQAVTSEAGALSVSYLDGDPAASLKLSFVDGVLSIGETGRTQRYTDFRRADFSPALDAEKNVYGISVALEAKDGEKISITARFGSTPMGSGLAQ